MIKLNNRVTVKCINVDKAYLHCNHNIHPIAKLNILTLKQLGKTSYDNLKYQCPGQNYYKVAQDGRRSASTSQLGSQGPASSSSWRVSSGEYGIDSACSDPGYEGQLLLKGGSSRRR